MREAGGYAARASASGVVPFTFQDTEHQPGWERQTTIRQYYRPSFMRLCSAENQSRVLRIISALISALSARRRGLLAASAAFAAETSPVVLGLIALPLHIKAHAFHIGFRAFSRPRRPPTPSAP